MLKDMNGFKNELIAVIRLYGTGLRGVGLWLCHCRCGKEIIRTAYQIRVGVPKSCGCYVQARRGNKSRHDYHTKHGLANKHPIYKCWKNIKTRCYNPNNQDWKNYGGKGIKVSDEWLHDSKAFIDWSFANGWSKGLTIDRIDPNKDYSRFNCQWITMSENSRKVKIDNPTLRRGENHRDASITEDTVRDIRKLLQAKMPQVRIMEKFKVSRNIVYQIKYNKTWKHVV